MSSAFTIGSRGTTATSQRVQAGFGPFAIVGSVFQTDAVITKSGPGIETGGTGHTAR